MAAVRDFSSELPTQSNLSPDDATEIYVVALLVLTSFFDLFPQLGLERLIRTRGEVVQLSLFFFASMIWILSVYDAYLVGRYGPASEHRA